MSSSFTDYACITNAAERGRVAQMEQFFLNSHRKWRGTQEQVDDISIAAIKIAPVPEEPLEFGDDDED